MKIIVAGGGTAGHINPAIAISKQMIKEEPSTEILFIGTKKGLETDLVSKAGFKITFIDVDGFVRKASIKNLSVLFKAFFSYNQASKIIKEFSPDVVVGTGGYVCGPVVFAAVRKKIPTIIHEQNVIPGLTIKILKRYVDIVAISFTQSMEYLKGAKKIIHTGNPIRTELLDIPKKDARERLGLDERPFVVAIGGSLGARNLNNAFIEFLAENRTKYQMLLSTGDTDHQRVMDAIKEHNLNLEEHANIKIEKYIYNMTDVYAAADLLITRAGAITISELSALGKPSVLIPSPNVAHNHQEYNAKMMEQEGASFMILEKDLENNRLTHVIHTLLSNPKRLKEVADSAYRIGIRQGAKKFCTMIKKLVESK